MTDDLKMLTREETAKLLNVSKEHISMLSNIGILKPIKLGKSYMFSQNCIREMQNNFKGLDLSNKKHALESINYLKENK